MRSINNPRRTSVRPLLSRESFAPAFRRRLVPGALVTGALVATPVYAQQAAAPGIHAGTLPAVIAQDEAGYQAREIQSRKFGATLQQTPKSITVIPEKLMQDRGAASLADVLRTTPGITLGSGEGGTPTGDRPFIRGYEASTDIFIDGARDYARGSHETFNLESVEVVKGPSSVLSGRGGTGGSINLVTKSPKLDKFFSVTAGYGTSGQWRSTIDGNYQFSDSGAIRLNAMKMGGEVPGRDGVDIDRWGIAPSIAFGLNTPTRLTLSYSHIENKDMPDLGVPFANEVNPGRRTPPRVDRDNFYGRRGVDFRENVFDTATAVAEHDINQHFTIRNLTRYSRTLNHYLMSRPTFDHCAAGAGGLCATEGPGAKFTRKDRARWRSTQSLINQTDLYGSFYTGSVKHNMAVGLELSKEDVYSKSMSGTPITSRKGELDSLYGPNSGRDYAYRLVYGAKEKDGDIKTRSVYVFDTLELNPQWSVNLGLRYDQFRVQNTRASRKDSFWNYQAGVVYKPVPYGSIYLTYSTSSNPSGENLGQNGGADGAAGAAQVRDLKPERSRSWELGTKWDLFDQRLSLTGALFQTDKTDARSTDPLTGDVSLSGSNRVRGLELGVAGSLTPQWDVWASWSWLDPKIRQYRSGKEVFDGNQMKFIARQSASIWTTYKVLPQVTVGTGATYMGKRFVDDANHYYLPSYWRYDAMVRYDVNSKLSFQLNANNLSNNEVYDASHVGLFANVGPGRSYMLTASYKF